MDDKNEIPLSFINVQISDNYGFALTLPTNEKGEILFSNLSGLYTVKVKENLYVMFKEEIDIVQSKEMTIKLIRCGALKGRQKAHQNDTLICLILDGKKYSLDANGSFELDNLIPGEHQISAEEINDKDEVINDNNEDDGQLKLLTIITIESGKTVEINIDDLLKK